MRSKLFLVTFLYLAFTGCSGYDEEALEDRITILEMEHKRHRHVDSSGKDTSEPVIRAVAVAGKKRPGADTQAEERTTGDHTPSNNVDPPKDDTPPTVIPPILPRTGQIAFQSGGEVYLMNTDGTNRTNLTNHVSTDTQPKWSPDGNQIAFLSNRASHHFTIFVMSADGSNQRLQFEVRDNIEAFDWLGHDNFVYTAQSDRIFINGIRLERIEGYTPTAAPNGQIAFVDYVGDNQEDILITSQFGGGVQSLIATPRDDDKRPVFSPSGAFIAFDNSWNIFVANADGTAQRQLTVNPNQGVDRQEAATWSPDGHHIAFAGHREPDWNWEIYVINIDGTNLRNITNTPDVDERFPDWSPR